MQIEAGGAMNETIEDGVGEGWILQGIPIRLRGLADLNGDGSWSRMRSIP